MLERTSQLAILYLSSAFLKLFWDTERCYYVVKSYREPNLV